QRAIELSPSYALSHQWYGITLLSVGRFEESIAEYKRAGELASLSLSINRGSEWHSTRHGSMTKRSSKNGRHCRIVLPSFQVLLRALTIQGDEEREDQFWS